jgi:hypothetical protein
MKLSALVSDQLAARAANDGESNEPPHSASTTLARSSECYERRHLIRIRLGKGDWWITVVLYLLICSLALILIQ